MPWMWKLKEINPAFRVTLFSVPALGSHGFWKAHPDWVEIAWHGWLHPDPYECRDWTRERMEQYLNEPILQTSPCRLWKAPGWQINEDIYQVLLERGWAVADQHLEDHRRPAGLPVYFYEDSPDRWHGHVQDWGSNGIRETWGELSGRVAAATEFSFASEAVSVGADADDSGS